MTTGWVVAAIVYALIVGLSVGSVVTARILHRRHQASEVAAHKHFLSVAADHRAEVVRLRAEARR
jgi:uncharacterized membrane-anchored protein YhcB (DUF1043 family)